MSSDAKILEGIGDYKYGFVDPENAFGAKAGQVVRQISAAGEPVDAGFQLKALEHFLS
jgi:hypothetical protein